MKLGFRLIDFVRKTSILEHYNWLCSFEGTGTDLALLQKQRLSELIMCLKQTNSFYGPFLRKIKSHTIKLDPHSILKQLPIMDKGAIRKHHKELTTNLPNRFEQDKNTGGSTGTPLYYKLDADSISLSIGYILFCWNRYADYSPGDPIATIAGKSLRSAHGRIKEHIYHKFQNNYIIPAESIASGMPLNTKRLSKVKLLFSYPTLLQTLVTENPHFPDLLVNLRAIFTTSEQLLPHIRNTLEATFSVKIFDMYGANDGGLISCEDHFHNGFRYHPLNCFIEEHLDCNGNSELLLTSLNSWTFPLVRYCVGDLANVGQPGQTTDRNPFPLISNLKGRTRDLIRLPSGKSVHGSAFNVILYRFPTIVRYRIIQSSNHQILVQIQVSDTKITVSSSLLSALLKLVENEVHIDIQLVSNFPISDRKFKLIESHVLEN